jgi:hypothetical protein
VIVLGYLVKEGETSLETRIGKLERSAGLSAACQ